MLGVSDPNLAHFSQVPVLLAGDVLQLTTVLVGFTIGAANFRHWFAFTISTPVSIAGESVALDGESWLG